MAALATMSVLAAVLLAAGALSAPVAAEPESCVMFEKPDTATGCPAAGCTAGAGVMSFKNCKRCDLLQFEEVLACRECKAGFDSIRLDDYEAECLKPSVFNCAPGKYQAPSSGTDLRKPCDSCSTDTVGVYATNPGWYDDASPSWSGKKICRTCKELGCTSCKSLVGCLKCPTGSVLLKTGPPIGTPTWIGLQDGYNSDNEAAPALPNICVKASDLGCEKSANFKGCTKCAGGKKPKNLGPQYLLGTQTLQFQPVGKTCK